MAAAPGPVAGAWIDAPDDVMVHVLERLSFAELAACAPVCRAWRRLCRCDQVWSRRCARRWCLGAMAHFAQDSPIRRGWESGKEGAALLEQLTALGLKGEPELSRAAEAIAQLRQLPRFCFLTNLKRLLQREVSACCCSYSCC